MNLLFLGASNTDCGHCFTPDNLGTGYVKFFHESFAPLCNSKNILLSLTNGGTDGFTFPRIYEKWKQFYGNIFYDAVIISGGINEVGVIHNTELTGIRKKEFLKHSCASLESLLIDLDQKGIPHILIIQPYLFSCPDYLNLWMPTLEEVDRLIRQCISEFRGSASISYLPTRAAFDKLTRAMGIQSVTTDGIHLTEAGHRCLAKLLTDSLGQLFTH